MDAVRNEDAELTPPVCNHAVQFYGTDESLFATVAGFVAAGLVEGQPAILIATPTHITGIISTLEKRNINVERARRLGDLVILDANDLLDMFLVAGMPNLALFEQHVGGIIEQTLRDRNPNTVIRAYGEMVDVLWKGGRADAALSLEMMWNRLAAAHRFALLCGYAMGNFYKRLDQFQQVCRHHSHVLDTECKVVPFDLRRGR